MKCVIEESRGIPEINYVINYEDNKYARTIWIKTFDVKEIKSKFPNLPEIIISAIINLNRKIKLDKIL